MRYLAAIFVMYLTLITVSPTVCQLMGGMQQMSFCSSEKSISAASEQTDSPDSPSEKSDDNKCCIPCCTIPSCNCAFVAVAPYAISPFEFGNLQKLRLHDETLVSNYLPDCWQPPEMV